MYHKWLDRWDERRAQRGDEMKHTADFVLDAEIGFEMANEPFSIPDFCSLADQAVADPTFFDDRSKRLSEFNNADGWIKFPSSVQSGIEKNNLVWAKVTDSGTLEHALVVFHHWNATKRNRQIANFFSKRGITVVEIAMPYHFERSRPGSTHADFILSSNLSRTMQSMRQAVLDGRKLISCLKSEGYGEISVLGMSLGSWVAGLVAAHDQNVKKASLFLAGGSLADMVWTGRATQKIRKSLEQEINLPDLRRVLGPLNLENYVDRLARENLDLQIVLATRDMVVMPELSQTFLRKLRASGANPNVLELNCGHYSLALPPYILFAGLGLKWFLKHGH